MKSVRQNTGIWVLLGFSALVAIATYKIKGDSEFTPALIFNILSTVVAAVGVLIFLFNRYMWKWPIFKTWLVLIPNLNGTWKGEIRSTWEDEAKKRIDPIPATLTIKQTLFHISCVMRTEEMTSSSFASGFVIDEDNQKCELCYSYNSVPNQTVIERSPQHAGTALLDIDEKPKKTLCGKYWTARKTTGDLDFKFWKKKVVKCFPDELRQQHPVSSARDYKS